MINPDIINQVSTSTKIPVEVVKEAYQLYWKYIKETIQALPLKDNLSEEEFVKLKTNFNISSLGKLTCTYDRMLGVKKKFNYLNNKSHGSI